LPSAASLGTSAPGLAPISVALSTRRAKPKLALAPQSSLVSIQAAPGIPFFCVHGAGGNVLNFRDIARRMGSEQAFYGLQARGVDGSRPLYSVSEMVDLYLSEITAASRGPYLLGGYSAGGIVAFEMARRLVRAGQSVPLLVLLDTFGPGVRPLPTKLKDHVSSLLREGPAYVSRRAREKVARHADEWEYSLKTRFYESHGQALPYALRDRQLAQAFRSATEGYQAQPYEGKAILYRANEVDPPFRHMGASNGWDALLPNLDVVEVPGNHDSLVYEPNVTRMSSHLAAALRQARVDS
jgi:thioesterase domain-containing protein